MEQIAEWLEKLGMAEYAERFAEERIEIDVLPELTDQDLERLGIPLGHRRRMLRAIRDLGSPSAAVAAPSAPAATEPTQRDDAEHRQLTVVFCDLVGSTALSTRLDPEDLRSVIGTYHKCVAETVARFDGFVAKYMGDGVLVYFGYPQAHEDDPERAVRAGLALIDAVGRLRVSQKLQVRIGVGTGLVVVGDLIGSGEAQERGVVGETPNLAARLQTSAAPNTVVVGPRTRRLLGDLFEYQDRGTVEVKGLSAPVQAYQVVRPSAVESRFEALRSTTTPLIGRDEEIQLLMRRWQQGKHGEGQIVLISGEPGIGKSRIAQTILERLGHEPHTRLRYFCSPYHQESAFYPIITQFERAAEFRREDTAEQRLAKLAAVLAPTTDDFSKAVPLFAALLSIPTGDRYRPLNLTPQKQREDTLKALLVQVELLAARHPTLMLVEDVHWIDPSSLEAFDLIIDQVPNLPVLLIMTFRPEFTPPWVGRPHVTLVSLNRLPRRHRAQMIAHLTGSKSLPKQISDQIIDRTDGVPLFIEELTKDVVESGALTEVSDDYSGPAPALAIPTTLSASLMARLDRLGRSAKEIAQIGAAIGRVFSHELLAAVARLSDVALQPGLERLAHAGLILERGTLPQTTYSFKHVLVQDIAYRTLLRSRRRQMHAHIAQALEHDFTDIVETEPERLAQHCTEGGLFEKGVDYWLKSGRKALARSATAEAIAQLTRGLELLTTELPDGPERHQREISLQIALGVGLIRAKGFAAPETGKTYARACELCRLVNDSPELFPALYGRYVFHFERAELHVAHDVAWELLRLAQERDDDSAQALGHRIVGSVTLQLGRFAEARTHLEAGLQFYDMARDRTSALVYAIDTRVICLTWLVHTLFALGYPDQARARNNEALAYTRELGHPGSLALAFWRACVFHKLCREPEAVQKLAEAHIAVARDYGFPQAKASGEFDLGWALVNFGQHDLGIAQMRSGLAAGRATGAERGVPASLSDLAEALGKTGQIEAALDLLREAMNRVDRTGERWYEAELHRLQGTLLLGFKMGAHNEIEACFSRALTVARQQNARLWELRAAMSMAQLWRDQGKRQQAHDLLASVYGWFTEGFDTLDLKEAKALLDQLT